MKDSSNVSFTIILTGTGEGGNLLSNQNKEFSKWSNIDDCSFLMMEKIYLAFTL